MSFFNNVGITTFPNQQLTATLTDGQMNTVNLVGAQTVRFDISGTWTGTVFFEASSDGIVYQTVQLLPFGPLLASQALSQSSISSTTQNGSWFGSIAGMDSFRLRASLVSGSVVTFNQISQAVSTLDVFEHADGFVDTHSSTTTPLGSNGVFTGPATDMLPFTAVRLSIFTDQPSVVATGLSIQWSSEGTNWDFQQNTGIPASAAGGGVHMVFGRISRYFRVVYTNGATPQTIFRMQVIHQRVTPPVASSFINQTLTDGDTAATVKAVLSGKNPSQVYTPVSLNSTNALLVDGSAQTQPVSLGNVDSKTVIGKTGTLVTTAVTADQVVLTYTVTGGKTFYLQELEAGGYQTNLPNTDSPVFLGTLSLENPSGTKLITENIVYGIQFASIEKAFAEPIPFAAGTVLRVVVTPAAYVSFTWRANFLGYEK